ncbi:MAG: methyltransferase domain-containing protein [Candidatus Woesearchaeota archaeon]|jgi:cyclopropane fatty-acyl-phospholipid synthase-like methyltransferase
MFDQNRKESINTGIVPNLPKKIIKLLNNKKAVLDIGCGNGWLTNYVSKTAYTGITYSKSEVENLKKIKCKATLLNIEKEKLPYKNESFDCVFASHILEHLEKNKLIEVMNEIKRVLKKGGVLILTTPTEYSFGFYGEWTHVRPYNHGSLPNMIKDFEFTNVDWTYPAISNMPKRFQRLGRFPLFFLKPILWKEVIAWGFKK